MGIFITLFNATPKADLRTGLASLFGFSNLYLLRQSVDYFDFTTELTRYSLSSIPQFDKKISA